MSVTSLVKFMVMDKFYLILFCFLLLISIYCFVAVSTSSGLFSMFLLAMLFASIIAHYARLVFLSIRAFHCAVIANGIYPTQEQVFWVHAKLIELPVNSRQWRMRYRGLDRYFELVGTNIQIIT